MLGAKTGNEALEAIGEDGIAKNNAELGQYGSTVLDYKEVDGFGSAIQYLGNNLALSLPQMGATAVAVAACSIHCRYISISSSCYLCWTNME